MKEFEIDVIDDLKPVYSQYAKDGLTNEVRMKAKKVYLKYLQGSSTMLREEIVIYHGGLEPIAYPNIPSVTLPTREEAEEIAKRLNELKEEVWREQENILLEEAKKIYKVSKDYDDTVDVDSLGDEVYDMINEEDWEKFRIVEKKVKGEE